VNAGIFGGTFDPPHTGHLIVAQDAALALGLDRILFIPAAQPPHKQGVVRTAGELRAHMVGLAIRGDARFELDRVELERRGPSFTVDTLNDLRERHPDTSWTLLMGADQYALFDTWRDPDGIRNLARLAVLTRGGTDGVPAGAGNYAQEATSARPVAVERADGTVAIEVTRVDVSSTAIRDRVATGLPIRYLVPAAVEAFIFEQRLYGRNGSSVTG
jgi:nicotinate-nucleotide adenylyltransferase